MNWDQYMEIALMEAKASLREGNHGFGAVIVKAGEIIAAAHDQEDTKNDPTSHAELNAIKSAAKKLGKNLAGCVLISTHEPCPICATAVIWAGISEIAYGYSIQEASQQGRKRIELTCKEIYAKAHVDVKIHEQVLHKECELLYRQDVRAEIKKLRNADDKVLCEWNEESVQRRLSWFKENKGNFEFIDSDMLNSAYRLLLVRFNITAEEAPISKKSDKQIIFHSQNFCPTLEACKILGLDTRIICKRLNENATDILIKQIDPRLSFSRNYEKLRPYTPYCEEMITVDDDEA